MIMYIAPYSGLHNGGVEWFHNILYNIVTKMLSAYKGFLNNYGYKVVFSDVNRLLI